MPSVELIARAFKIDYFKVETYDDMNISLPRLLEEITGPIIVELITDESQEVLFSQGYMANNDGTFSPSPLSEMKPFT